MKTTLWLYSLQISDVDQPSITAQCLGVTNASGRSIRMYAYHVRRTFNEVPDSESDVLVYVDNSTMLPEKVEVTGRDGKYIDEWKFDPSIRVGLPASGKLR